MKSNSPSQEYQDSIFEAANFVKARLETAPDVGILTGTGLGEMVEFEKIFTSIDYEEIPHFPMSTVESHIGRLFFGSVAGKSVAALKGRFHLYEGYSPLEVTFPIRMLQVLGVKSLILSNAAGGINPLFEAGNIMIISDHINLTGENPLVGYNIEEWGIRFPDMIQAYDKHLIEVTEDVGRNIGIHLEKGVYVGLKGPSLETPAETRFLKTIGADAVGFSTVQEVIAAVHGKIKVLGLSTITNINDPDNPAPTTVEDVISIANAAVPKLKSIITNVISKM